MSSDINQFLKNLKRWQKETSKLRAVILKTKLEENIKWNLPCYSHEGQNIAIIQPFKSYLGLMFFKGALLKDPKKALVKNGPNSQSSRRLEFDSVAEISKMAPIIIAYLREAIAVDKSGKKVKFKRKPETLPEELVRVFAKKARLKKAFLSLTPGRQRAYLLHFNGAKQPATRQSRIEKCIPRILEGKGMQDP